ncbi:hypothetical protein [Saccharopolyspora sp. NPDC002686]|uniref:hypothetical protein n=1 Tax=Saccharopolyspora sp. NPDC002686 TaxID=3154541 RepID=UPI0033224ADA
MSTESERPTSGDAESGRHRHAAPEGADVHPLIDLSRDPHPGVPDHAKPDED